ncbi:MAG: hypothetical protein KME49_09025 [Brasilonema octagenarum HA4186-MV1]|jgi:hypothetical protein|nr:hypothetical protein [Brasilonema octagenarum HA4186-MV1]
MKLQIFKRLRSLINLLLNKKDTHAAMDKYTMQRGGEVEQLLVSPLDITLI